MRSRVAHLCAVVCAMTMLWSCGMARTPEKDEVTRLRSPDNAVDAVLLEWSGGATTSFGYDVLLVPKDARDAAEPAAHFYGATRNAQAYGVDLEWTGPRALELRYLTAREARLSSDTVSVDGRQVRLLLHPGVQNPTAPAGGMASRPTGDSAEAREHIGSAL